MLVPIVCVLLFGLGLLGARSLRRVDYPVPKWSLVVASSIAMLALFLVRQ